MSRPFTAPPGPLDVDLAVEHDGFRLEVATVVEPGEVLGVLGPNGAGKTTLLRVLAGLTATTQGWVRLGDAVLDDAASGRFVPPEDRPVGLVFQSYRLFPHLSVLDNVAFAARSRGGGRGESRRHAQAYLDRLGIGSLAARRPARLSGGQAQRVALARALAAEPALLLLDEPLSALDARTRVEVRSELTRHLADFAGPCLLVTHDPLEAMVMTDRLLVVEDGHVVQHGSPAEVARRPRTQYVAKLVGLNLYRGRLDAGREHVRLEAGGSLAVAPEEDVDPGDVLVALRPAAVSVHTVQPLHASPRNVWRGRVTGMELLTDRVRVQVEGEPPALVDLTPAAVAELGLAPGLGVWLSAKATEAEVYRSGPTRATRQPASRG